MQKVFISCGELSGEIHASNLIKELRLTNEQLIIKGFGSSIFQENQIELLANYKDYSFSGISEILANLSKIFQLEKDLYEKIIDFQPDIIITVDYGAFHTRLAKKLKRNGFKGKIIQFIAPQIWASRPWRIKDIKKAFDKVLCTLPFEEKIYAKHRIPHRFVGNPVFASLSNRSFKKDLNVEQSETLIGVFPGSRKSEIKHMLPIMIKSAQAIKKQLPQRKFKFLLAKAPSIDIETLNQYGFDKQDDIELLETNNKNPNHTLLSAADALWLCSGTVTLEAAFYGTPYFLSYKSTQLNYLLYRIFRTIDKAGLVNIIAGRDLVREFIQSQANEKNFIEETLNWFEDNSFSNYYHLMQKALEDFSQDFAPYPSYKLCVAELKKELN